VDANGSKEVTKRNKEDEAFMEMLGEHIKNKFIL
jgi:hypothetical protein